MSKKSTTRFFLSLVALLTFAALLIPSGSVMGAGSTTYPWPSFRHDILCTGAAPDSGYPITPTILWSIDREDRTFSTGPAPCRGPVVVDNGKVITTGTGVAQANDQFTGALLWSRTLLYEVPPEPAGAPTDWCYNDIPTVNGNTGVCYVENMGDCPSWCFECTTDQPDCSKHSLVSPLRFPEGYDQFLSGATIDPSFGSNGCVIFGSFDGHVFSLDLGDGSTIWAKTPYKDPGGPNVGKPWYNQKWAWHLSPPSIYNGKLYIGTFLPSFYAVFRPWAYTSGPDYPWPTIASDATHYWAGRDGYFYAMDESDGSIVWTWDPRG